MNGEEDHPGGDKSVFAAEFMQLMARTITFAMPTICAVNGHAFGAGFMFALCHDLRFMREDRGYMCANEMDLGMAIPDPELALFRHKIPMHAFFETVQLARRWTGPAALSAGIVQATASLEDIRSQAVAKAAELARLGERREVYRWMKEHIYGENAAINGPHGPAYMLRNQQDYARFGDH